MDSTYETNKYNFPLLEIVGVTSTKSTFSVAFGFMECEKEENYSWMLEKLKNIMDPNNLPLITQKRRFSTQMWKAFNLSWDLLMMSENPKLYNDHLKLMKRDFHTVPEAIEYVEQSWLGPYKERAESTHGKLKSHLGSSQCNFARLWEIIDKLINLQITEIKGTFERNLSCWQHEFRIPLFDHLKGVVLKEAMRMIIKKANEVEILVASNRGCDCSIRCTLGLPCSHEIAPFKRASTIVHHT
ncbi:hypothetical protein Vadar_005624 [Vaccinium darrowii]|uniref:Uncharacterized protein n=1 Tax=Vaccinium darrowii TaxID=229202 RepID=A0ACB7WYN1_9ERIC|nr:hypothetical protein Vadar_005624 [Vaccinium darrowii]